MQDTTIAVDLAKSVFEVAVSHSPGKVSKRHRLSRKGLRHFLPSAARSPECFGSAARHPVREDSSWPGNTISRHEAEDTSAVRTEPPSKPEGSALKSQDHWKRTTNQRFSLTGVE